MTPQEKQNKKARDNLKLIHNRILAAFSLRQIQDWCSLFKHLGYDDEYIHKNCPRQTENLTFQQLKEFLLAQKQELEDQIAGLTVQEVKPASQDTTAKDTTLQTVEPVAADTKVERVYLLQPKVVEAELKVVEKEEPVGAKDNYGLVPSPNEKVFWYWFQKKALAELKKKAIDERRSGILVLAPTGTGKTFLTYGLVRRLLDANFHDGLTWSHIPYLVLTKATIVEQHKRVAQRFFNIHPEGDIEITNIEALRSKAGQLWVKEQVKIVNGAEIAEYIWKKNINPAVVLLDESQGVKNKKAKQSRIIHGYNELPNACLVSISATPFVRVSEAQAFAVSTHRPLDHLRFPKGTKLTNETWPAYAAIIASPSRPDEYNQAAIERLMKDLEPWIVRVRGVKPQYDAQNGVVIKEFETPEKRAYYSQAWEKFQAAKKKLDDAAAAGDSTGACYLVILLAFSMAAEFCHAEGFADDMHEAVMKRGKAAVAAVKFKQTLIEIVRILIEKHGWKRSDISLIWGGGQTQLTKKQKAKAKIKEMEDKFKEMGITLDEMLGDTGLEDVEDRVIVQYPEEYKLGAQDKNERQKEIDNFQAGKTLFCIYTLKSGGVGLSLHHTDELTTFKCRRKESGYAVEEDIPKVPVRPRETFVVVTYNAIELVQGVGRVPRLTSLSPTVQNVYCYAGTVEVDMGRIYSQKLRCLSSVVKQREDWQDVIFGGGNRARVVEDVIKKTEGVAQDESSLIDEGDTEEDDE